MGKIFNLINNMLKWRRTSTTDSDSNPKTLVSDAIDETHISKSIDWKSIICAIIEDGYTPDHFDEHDLRIVAGNKTLTIIYDRRELGLHSFRIYDYCTTSDEEGHKMMAQIIRENEDEAYKSLIIESSKDELLINIADCTNRGGGQLGEVCNQMIKVFEPIILKFIKSNAVNNNIGLCVSFGEDSTSLGAHLLCQKLKELGLNIHIAIIEQSWDTRMKNKIAVLSAQMAELSCSCKMYQFPYADKAFDWDRFEESFREVLLESVSYLKSVISS